MPTALFLYVCTTDCTSFVWTSHLSQLAGIPENVYNAKRQYFVGYPPKSLKTFPISCQKTRAYTSSSVHIDPKALICLEWSPTFL